MLEHVPAWLGHLLGGVRAGADKLAIADSELVCSGMTSIAFSSIAFADGGRLPVRFTADGDGVSPPLGWGDVPAGTAALALIVEDADAPMPSPIVHAVAWGIDPGARGLDEGVLADGASGPFRVGTNSYSRAGWLPPDPPTGHGEHRYVFQLFALGGASDPGEAPGRTALLDAMRGHVLAAGVLTGVYSRGEEATTPIAAAPAIVVPT